MKISQFTYTLPQERIAHSPAEPRDSSKLMLLDRNSGTIEHKIFNQLPHILTSNDVLVFNKTKVIPARLFGHKESGGKIEILLLRQLNKTRWQCIGKNIPDVGQVIYLTKDNKNFAKVISKSGKLSEIDFQFSQENFEEFLDAYGNMPLPPYIHNSWASENDSKARQKLKTTYNTIYAKDSGSAAAPTAGLHFTDGLLDSLKKSGVELEYVTLHVGLGTFEPVTSESLHNHVMHSEEFTLSSDVAQYLNDLKKQGSRIIAVGTTTTRVLETCSDDKGILHPQTGSTDIFIYPPYRFKFIDGLITNFHLPKSTLLALVSAFVSQPNTANAFTDFESSVIGNAYAEAISKKYRFYSFGDAMFIH